MSRGDFSGQQWLISVPSPATGGYNATQSVATDMPDGNSQSSQNHLDAIRKIAGGLGTVYTSHKPWKKLT